MAFEFNQTNLSKLKEESVCEFSVSGKFSAIDGEDVKSVVKVDCYSEINNSDILGPSASFNGQTNVSVCYLNEEGELKAVRGQLEWQNKSEVKELESLSFYAKNKDVEFKISGDTIFVSCLVEIECMGLLPTVVSNLVENENLVCKKQVKEVKNATSNVSDSFNIIEDLSIDEDIENVVSVSPSIVLKAVNAGQDKVALIGTVYLEIIAQAENGALVLNKNVDFAQEVSMPMASDGDEVYARLNMLKCDYIFTENDNKKTLSLTLGALANAVLYKKEEIEVSLDAYLLDRDSKISLSCEELSTTLGQNTKQETLNFSFGLEEFPQFDELLYATPTRLVEWNYVASEKCVCGTIELGFVFRADGGKIAFKVNTMPFSVSVGEDYTSVINVAQTGISAKVHGGHEIIVETMLEITMAKTENRYLEFVSRIEDCGELTNDESAIITCIAEENDDVFSISKKLKARPEDIMMQNDISEVKPKDKILVYRHKDGNFNY
ncbi:MAG: DUF3794 domain-containing protein [Clostridia bacterium]|nr:DUF3794 domain-containing protein [Clostridia bacterium]